MGDAPRAAFQAADPLLHTKLMPPRLHEGVIPRRELLARLDEGLSKKLTLLVAPTGFGKSTLVSQWAASRKFRSAWVTLDENDNDPSRFWTYVVHALRGIDSSIGRNTLSALMASQPASYQTLLTPLINDLMGLRQTCVLILEDYHFMTSGAIHAGLAFLIQHTPSSFHLALITRSEPDLPLGILRARDELLEIQSPDLRFNRQEVQTFLQGALKSELPSAAMDSLIQKTEGWPAGLRLLTLSLKDKEDAAGIEQLAGSFSGSDRLVADYLIREVFESQSEARQNFFLKTCFFRRLTGSLCDAITGNSDGASLLEQIERENLFITQLEHAGEPPWYRYNPLFAGSLQYLARRRMDATLITQLFEQASRWYEAQGIYDEAIETALSAKLYERALTLIEKYIEIHELSELFTLSRWLENLPAEQMLRHPAICLTYAQVILYSMDRFAPVTAARIDPLLRAAESAWRARQNHQGLGRVLSFQSNVALWQGDFPKAFEYAHQSLEELPESDILYRGTSLLMISHEALSAGRILEAQDVVLEARALLGAAQNIYGVLAALQVLGECFFWQGELDQAGQLNRQILDEAVGESSMLDDQGIASLNLARIAYEQNDLDSAYQFASRALDLSQRRSNDLLQTQAVICLACILASQNDSVRAEEMLKSLAARVPNPSLLRDIQEAQARLSIRSGGTVSLEGWRSVVANDKQNGLPLQKERQSFTLARLQMGQGAASEALQTLEPWLADAIENGRLRSQVEALCLQALAHQAGSNPKQAAAVASEALALGHAKGFRRLFLDEGPSMAALLQAVLPALADRSLSLYATALLQTFSLNSSAQKLPSGSSVLGEPLSRQEQRVLRLLVAGRSNADIARELVVSTNTVKTQVKSIYRKLNINSREEARLVARELKLL